MRIVLIIFSVLILFQNSADAQQHQDTIDNKKIRRIVIAESAIYTVGMTSLAFLWYKDSHTQSFKFFNDNDEWLQMDKMGHAFTAYHLAEGNYQLLKNMGVKPKKAMLFSSISSVAMMLPIELMDGFSEAYGASWGDAVANTIGAFLPYQQFLFDQNYIYPKFSFARSPYAELRPNTLGNNYFEQLLKDYNGQTYWISTDFNIFSKQNKFPNWLQFSVGYSGNQMVYGTAQHNKENGYKANRQWLLSLDMNLSKIEVEQKWLKIMLNLVNRVKIPFPTLEWDGKSLVLHPLYF